MSAHSAALEAFVILSVGWSRHASQQVVSADPALVLDEHSGGQTGFELAAKTVAAADRDAKQKWQQKEKVPLVSETGCSIH